MRICPTAFGAPRLTISRPSNLGCGIAAIDAVAWYQDNSDYKMHKVGQKRANGFGLCDVLGNVDEWVNDWYDADYYKNSPSRDPTGPPSGKLRVLRGGSWGDPPAVVRISFRYGYEPGYWGNFVGIRCAREVDIP
jgi:formylglycine-generating enzyme required for sulfatase activity